MKVASGMDSRIVLDQKGAELLLGHGDMLFLSPASHKLTRSQGTLVGDDEIRKTTRFLKGVAQQHFEPQLVQLKSGGGEANAGGEDRDPLFEQAVNVVLETQRGSVSLLQRRLTIGYGRASRLIEEMAAAGIIGEYKGSQAREVLISAEEWEAIKAQAEADAQAEENQSNQQQVQGTLYDGMQSAGDRRAPQPEPAPPHADDQDTADDADDTAETEAEDEAHQEDWAYEDDGEATGEDEDGDEEDDGEADDGEEEDDWEYEYDDEEDGDDDEYEYEYDDEDGDWEYEDDEEGDEEGDEEDDGEEEDDDDKRR